MAVVFVGLKMCYLYIDMFFLGMLDDMEVVIVVGSMMVCIGIVIFGVCDYFKK